MKNYNLILSAAILVLASCSVSNPSVKNNTNPDSAKSQTNDKLQNKTLFAKMQIKDTIKNGAPVQLKFTVYNKTDSAKQFCKWHTPFEPLISKYLTVKDQNGEEAAYQGPMAKRIMPPPATSYITINPNDSLSVDVDLLKAYAIKNPSRYTITYTGQNISGLVVQDSISFIYLK